jgi:hypothetical protein
VHSHRFFNLLKSAEISHRSEPREQFKIPRRDHSGDTLFIGEPICGLWQRGKTRRVSAKMVTIDTGDTSSHPGYRPERRARRTPRANNTPRRGNILAPVIIGCRAQWSPLEQRAMKISRAFLLLPEALRQIYS